MNVPRQLPHGPAIFTAVLLLAVHAADAFAADPPRAPAPPPPPWGSVWPPAVPMAPVAPPPGVPVAPPPGAPVAPPPGAPAPPRSVAEPPAAPPPLPPPVASDDERARDLANADRERARDLANADRERARALASAERERERARAEIERARERARAEIERERERTRRGERRPPAPPPPHPPHVQKHHHHYHPVFPKGFPFNAKSQVIVIRGEEREERAAPRPEESPPPPPPPDRPVGPLKDADRGAAGGIAFSAGATNLFGLVPLDGDLMAGARLQLALAAPSESSRWLSNAAFGLTGGVDAGQHRGTDAQVWHAGASFALGAPWSRDVLGVAVEGGLLGGRYYDGNATAYRQSTKQLVPGPVGEGFGPKFYGLGRLVIQVPLKGDVRPFLAGELGATERADDKPSAIAGVTGGLVWNAW